MLRAEKEGDIGLFKKAFFGVQHAPHLILLFPLKLMERNIVSFVKRKACLHSEFSMSTTIERLLTWGGPLSMLAACAFAWLVRSGRSRCGSVGHVQQHTIVSSWKSWKQMIFWADDFNGFGTYSHAADCPTFLCTKAITIQSLLLHPLWSASDCYSCTKYALS